MNREDIIRMGQEVYLCDKEGRDDNSIIIVGHLERFAALVASAERERILDICKEGLWDAEGIRYHLDIRARGQA